MSEEPQDRTPGGGRSRRPRRRRPAGGARERDAAGSSGPQDGAPHSSGTRISGPEATGRTSGTRTSGARTSAAGRTRRAAVRAEVVVPPITYPEQLPVSARRAEISAAIRDHQVVVVSGETGSGKTTQLPKILLDLGRGRAGQIGHTQPRRIAARTVAERISEELTGGPGALGTLVGYQVRFTDQSSEQTLVKVMTDGILLAQIQRDPLLLGYDTLIIDEAHERSLNIDFLLGYLTRLLPKRPDLKLVITSATIDSGRFARHFSGPATAEHPEGVPAPVVEVTGRTYPVEVRYRPLSPDAPAEDDDAPPHARGETAASGPGSRGAAGQRRGGRAGATTPARGAEDRDLMTALCEAVDELSAEGPGDILAFFSGEREIRDAEDALRSHLGPLAVGSGPRSPRSVEIVPLYSRLSSAEQHRVFERHDTRRVVLATNVAETSLTVPGVRYVIDPGTARISRWSKATKVQRLPIEPISQASANQRSGRCGRVADGIAIRLYSQDDFASRPEFTEPEILRTSLASVILQMIAVGVAASPADVSAFPFVDPPDTRSVRDGVQLLTELGALETSGGTTRLTETGRALALLPMDPRLARMIVEGGRRDVAREVMIIAAALSIQDPRERPSEQREVADASHARFADRTSDFLSYLNLWHYVRDQQRELSGSAFRRLCKAEHLNYLRLREWQDVVTQLKELAKPLGITVRPPARVNTASSGPASGAPGNADATDQRSTDAAPDLRLEWDADRIHQALLAGLLSHLGMQEATEVKAGGARETKGGRDARGGRARPRNEYLGARGARFAIFPGSALARKPPAWVMAGELVETSRLWGRDVARIQPEWAEELASHLVKRTYSEPAWSTKQGAATALEKVLLYGVPIVAQRKVLFSKVDPEHARELFLRHALVQGEWTTHHDFFARNRALLDEATELENRARRRGLVVDDDTLYAFYDARVPADVVSARHFDQWWKGARRRDPDLLTFDLEMLVADDAAEARDPDLFPDVWPHGDLLLPLTYQFDPGTESDGVTVHIPVAVLNRVVEHGFDRLVPGLEGELAVATIRALPKPVRVQLVPAPDVAAEIVSWIRRTQPAWADVVRAADMAPSWHEVFAAAVRDLRGVEIPDDAWDDSRLPAHLRMTFRVQEDRRGGTVLLDEGTDLRALQRRLAAHSEQAVRSAVRDAVREAVRERDRRDGPDGGSAGRSTTDGTVAPSGTGAPGATGAGPAAPGSHGAGTTSPGAPRPGAPRPGVPEASPPGPGLDVEALTDWPGDLPDGVLPEQVTTTAGGLTVHGYPCLVVGARGTGPGRVDLRVLTVPAPRRHAEAVRELLLGSLALPTGRVTSRWSAPQSLTLAASPYPTTAALVLDLQRTALDALIAEATTAPVRDAATFARLRTTLRDTLEDRTARVADDAATVLAAARDLDGDLRGSSSLALLGAVQDVRGQLAALVPEGFLVRTGATRLPHLVRYLKAARHRLAKAAENPGRDEGLAWQVRELEQEYATARAARDAHGAGADTTATDARLDEVRWLLEELRVSLFAQQLGTPVPVSAKRIRTLLAAG